MFVLIEGVLDCMQFWLHFRFEIQTENLPKLDCVEAVFVWMALINVVMLSLEPSPQIPYVHWRRQKAIQNTRCRNKSS